MLAYVVVMKVEVTDQIGQRIGRRSIGGCCCLRARPGFLGLLPAAAKPVTTRISFGYHDLRPGALSIVDQSDGLEELSSLPVDSRF